MDIKLLYYFTLPNPTKLSEDDNVILLLNLFKYHAEQLQKGFEHCYVIGIKDEFVDYVWPKGLVFFDNNWDGKIITDRLITDMLISREANMPSPFEEFYKRCDYKREKFIKILSVEVII